jgi:hypothetical protein
MATAPTLTERPAKKFEPRTISFPADVQEEINTWIHKQIESLSKRLENLHSKKVPEWRRIVEAKPKEENRSWPFVNASNIVHPLVGESIDDIAARVLQLIWLIAPLVFYRYFQETKDTEAIATNTAKSKSLEKFMDYVSYDPRELNLYTRENKWYVDAAGLGKAWVCVAPEHRLEAVFAGYDESAKGSEFEEKTLYEGPKVINLRYEDILIDPDVEVFEDNDPIIRRCTLNKRKLQERAFKGHFDSEKVKAILGQPDRYGTSPIKSRENRRKGISDTIDSTMAEWDIYECYFSWYHNKKKFRLIAWYHDKTKTTLNCVYNFIPDNQVPIVETRLSVTGMGFAEMLKNGQEEVSTAKNQRNDAITWGILGINTISPQNRNIDRNFTLWPGICLPMPADDFSHHEVANPAMSGVSLQNEQAMIQMVKERAGVGPAITGAGAGSANKKGQFGSMGTMSVLAQGNSRNDHRQSDFRHSHVNLMSLLTDFYGFLGLGRKGEAFGLDDKLLEEALQDYLQRKLRIPIRAATASMNKEVTKQNEIILNQAISAYIKETSSQLQAYLSPGLPPEYKKWLMSVIKAKTRFFQTIIRDFQLSDSPQEFIPDIDFPEEQPNVQAAAQPGPGAGLSKVAEIFGGRGAGGAVPSQPVMGGAPGGSQGQS